MRPVMGKDAPIPTSWWFAAIAGFLAGATTMISLPSMRLPKEEFIGTRAWYFFILNLGLITVESLTFEAVPAGGVVVGAFMVAVQLLIQAYLPFPLDYFEVE